MGQDQRLGLAAQAMLMGQSQETVTAMAIVRFVRDGKDTIAGFTVTVPSQMAPAAVKGKLLRLLKSKLNVPSIDWVGWVDDMFKGQEVLFIE